MIRYIQNMWGYVIYGGVLYDLWGVVFTIFGDSLPCLGGFFTTQVLGEGLAERANSMFMGECTKWTTIESSTCAKNHSLAI
jgi:hypothetical protein